MNVHFSSQNGLVWQKYSDDRAALWGSLPASKLDLTVMPVHNLTANSESKSSAIEAFGNKNGVKGFLHGFPCHSSSAVSNGEVNALCIRGSMPFACAYQQPATSSPHCIDGIRDQIAQNLTYLIFEATDGTSCAMPLFENDPTVQYAALVHGHLPFNMRPWCMDTISSINSRQEISLGLVDCL
jgi:hypothetical protein